MVIRDAGCPRTYIEARFSTSDGHSGRYVAISQDALSTVNQVVAVALAIAICKVLVVVAGEIQGVGIGDTAGRLFARSSLGSVV
jgi:hypothetical protein